MRRAAGERACADVDWVSRHGALNAKVRDFNLEVVQNRYGREAIYLGLNVIWIYRICTVLDLFIFNSIEFWSGTNPINGKNALADIPLSAAQKISLREVDRAQVEWVSENDARLIVDFANGDHMSFDVTGRGRRVGYDREKWSRVTAHAEA